MWTGKDMGVMCVAEAEVSRVGTRSAIGAAVEVEVGAAGEDSVTAERRNWRLCACRKGDVVTIVWRRGFEVRGSSGSPCLPGCIC